MICNTQEMPVSSRSLIVSRIVEEVSAVPGASEPSREIEHIAHGVAAYIEGRPGAVCVESDYVLLTATRALASMGRENLARRWVAFRSGVARFSHWAAAGSEPMLVLDISRLRLPDGGVELALFSTVGIVLDAVADVWNESKGRGVLGLRRAADTAAALLGTPLRGRRTAALTAEVMAFCGERTRWIGEKRGWVTSPRIMNLDI